MDDSNDLSIAFADGVGDARHLVAFPPAGGPFGSPLPVSPLGSRRRGAECGEGGKRVARQLPQLGHDTAVAVAVVVRGRGGLTDGLHSQEQPHGVADVSASHLTPRKHHSAVHFHYSFGIVKESSTGGHAHDGAAAVG